MIANARADYVVQTALSRDTISSLLFHYLNENNIGYAFVESDNDFQNAAEAINLVIAQKEFTTIAKHLQKFCKKINFILVQNIGYETTASLVVLSHYDKQSEQFINIKINVFSDYKKHGRFYLPSKELLHNRSYVSQKNYWKLNPAYSFICNFLNVIDRERINHEQFSQLLKEWKCANTSIAQLLKRFFKGNSIEVIKKSFNEKDEDYLNTHLADLYKDLQLNIPKRVRDIIPNKLFQIKNALKPSGLMIGILGRDGCGKSTFANEMANSLGPYFNGTNVFKKFPAVIYKGEIFKKKEEYHFSKPHYHTERDSITSFMKLTLMFIEFMLGYWIKLFPLKRKSHVILYDRYFADLLADPVRNRIKGNRFFIKAFHYILPKPDLWIILDLPSEILLKRKQELTYEMAENLRQKYLELQSFLPNCVVISNESELKKTMNTASAFVFNYMNQRISAN